MRRLRDLTTKEKIEYLAIFFLLPFAYIWHLFRKANFRTLSRRGVAVCLAVVMIAAMIPIMSVPASAASAEMSEPFFTTDARYEYISESDRSSVPISSFDQEIDNWDRECTSVKTKDFIALFVVLKVRMDVPAYSQISLDFIPDVGAGTLTPECSSTFGVELFHFDNEGDWNNITFNTDENRNRSNEYSLGREIDHVTAGMSGDSKASFKTSLTLELDNANDEAKTEYTYFGILGFYRKTSVFPHQLDLGWNFLHVYNYPFTKYIHYDAGSGSGSANTVIAGDYETVTLHSGEGFTKPNSAFVGWYDGSTSYAPGGEYSKDEGALLSAQYLTYDLSDCDGTVTPDIREGNGFVIASADNIYKVGHTFQNWNTHQNGIGTAYAPGDVYSANKGITLYPYFKPNKYDVTILSDNCTTTLNQNPATYGTLVEITTTPSVGYQLETFEVYKTDDPTVKVPLTGANTFVQPEYPVTVKPVLSKIPYAIESLPTENGSFTVSHETACIDDVVTVTATPNEGFELDAITVTRANSGEPLTVTGNSFTMVPEPVKVAVAFKNSVYDITKAPATNGSFTLNPEHAIMGQTVIVNAVPNEGYQVKSITVYKTDDETVTVDVTAGSFVMPAYPVTVAVEFETASLEVFKSTGIENGDITISHTEAHLGETVNISPVGAEGYTLDAITVYKTGDPSVTVAVAGNSFVMPTYPVTVHATFKKIDYTVSVVDDANEKGSFTVDKTTAQIGDTVTVDITCAEGWAVRGITLTNSNGESKLVDKTFTMPASNVTVSVSYMVIPTYVITIPATVELGGAPMTVAITNAVMEEGVSLKVYLETDFTARTDDGAEKTFDINAGAVQSGDVVLMVEGGGTPENPKQGSTQLALEWDETYQYSGNYRATLAFTIRVEDEGYDQTE